MEKIMKSTTSKKKKTLPGNGQHQAICTFQGILHPKDDQLEVMLPGVVIPCLLRGKIKYLYEKNPEKLHGIKNFGAYPKNDGTKLAFLDIIFFNDNHNYSEEKWLFTGMWENDMLLVQRASNSKPSSQCNRIYKYCFSNNAKFVFKDKICYSIEGIRSKDEVLIKSNKVLKDVNYTSFG